MNTHHLFEGGLPRAKKGFVANIQLTFLTTDRLKQWRTEGGWGFQPPSRNSEDHPKSCQTEPNSRKLLKITEFRMPTPQDVQKKGSKILKLPRFAILLH